MNLAPQKKNGRALTNLLSVITVRRATGMQAGGLRVFTPAANAGNLLPEKWRFIMKIRPFEERIVVEMEEPKEAVVGGIYVPESAKEKPIFGRVIAVGCGEVINKLVSVGDRVIFNKYAGSEFTIDGKKIMVLNKDDLLGKIEE